MVDGLLSLSPVIPVVVLDDAADAVPLARALLAGRGAMAVDARARIGGGAQQAH